MNRRPGNAVDSSRDHAGMRTVVAPLLAAFFLASGCGDDTPAAQPSSTPSATSAETTSATAAPTAEPANGVTTDACRSLSTDKDLAEFWQAVRGGDTAGHAFTSKIAGAFLSVYELQTAAQEPGVAQEVAAAMSAASVRSVTMRADWVKTATLDTAAFSAMLTPVVTACQAAGVAMDTP